MWYVYILDGILFAIVLRIAERMKLRGMKLTMVTLGGMGIVVAGFYLNSPPPILGERLWWNHSPWWETVLFSTMLAGMASRYLTRAIDARRTKLAKWRKAGSVGDRPGIEFDKWEFSYPLLVAAMTFGGLLSQIKNDTLTTENLLLSFQTGFFWQTILVRAEK